MSTDHRPADLAKSESVDLAEPIGLVVALSTAIETLVPAADAGDPEAAVALERLDISLNQLSAGVRRRRAEARVREVRPSWEGIATPYDDQIVEVTSKRDAARPQLDAAIADRHRARLATTENPEDPVLQLKVERAVRAAERIEEDWREHQNQLNCLMRMAERWRAGRSVKLVGCGCSFCRSDRPILLPGEERPANCLQTRNDARAAAERQERERAQARAKRGRAPV